MFAITMGTTANGFGRHAHCFVEPWVSVSA